MCDLHVVSAFPPEVRALDTKEARRDELIALFQDRAEAWAAEQVGKRMRVIIDRMDGFDAIGRTHADAPDIDGSVRLPECLLLPGTELEVRVVAADVMELVAQPVDESEAEDEAAPAGAVLADDAMEMEA